MAQMLINQDRVVRVDVPMGARGVVEARRRRVEARALLRSLIASKALCDRQMAQFERTDAMEQVRGCSSFDQAIDSTQQMIQVLDEAVARFEPAMA